MTAIIRPRPWTQQPQIAVGIDWSNPIAAKLSACALPGNGTIFNYGKNKVELTGTKGGINASLRAGVLGIGAFTSFIDPWKLHSTANATTAWEEPTAQATFLCVCVRFSDNYLGNAPIFGNQSAYTSPYSAWAIVDRSGTGIFGVECSAGGSVYTFDVASGLSSNVPMVLVGRYDGAKLESFRDGKKSAGSTACSGSLVYPASRRGPAIGNFYDYPDAGRAFNGAVYLVALWPVALSDAEIRSISDNPWQIFRPRVT